MDHPLGDPLPVEPGQLLDEVLVLEEHGTARSGGLAALVVDDGRSGLGRQDWLRHGTSTVLGLSNGRTSLGTPLTLERF